jgi:hypothetical protein
MPEEVDTFVCECCFAVDPIDLAVVLDTGLGRREVVCAYCEFWLMSGEAWREKISGDWRKDGF